MNQIRQVDRTDRMQHVCDLQKHSGTVFPEIWHLLNYEETEQEKYFLFKTSGRNNKDKFCSRVFKLKTVKAADKDGQYSVQNILNHAGTSNNLMLVM